jgi:hypothetical protein
LTVLQAPEFFGVMAEEHTIFLLGQGLKFVSHKSPCDWQDFVKDHLPTDWLENLPYL